MKYHCDLSLVAVDRRGQASSWSRCITLPFAPFRGLLLAGLVWRKPLECDRVTWENSAQEDICFFRVQLTRLTLTEDDPSVCGLLAGWVCEQESIAP